MTARHPVPDELLLDFAVGSTGPGKTLLVATHLSMCPESRRRYAMLQAVGGALLDSLAGEELDRISAESVLAKADEAEVASRPSGVRPSARADADPGLRPLEGKLGDLVLPEPLARHARELADPRAWRKLGLGVEAAVLPSVSTPQGKTQILRARPGVRIVTHTHLGEEAVLLLKGAFWDGDERFGAGDVAVSDGSTTHAPRIDAEEECICLAVTEGPIKFVGPYGWALNLFNRF